MIFKTSNKTLLYLYYVIFFYMSYFCEYISLFIYMYIYVLKTSVS